MNEAIIICSRLDSSRIPGKALKKINGKPIINHILDRQLKYGFKVIMAVPDDERSQWRETMIKYGDRVKWFFGFKDDPMKRMLQAAILYNIDTVIRQTHDKIFLSPDQIKHALEVFRLDRLDYISSSSFISGTAFEIMSLAVLKKAVLKYKNVEHITYAVRALTDKYKDLNLFNMYPDDIRLLIDFPEDLELMECLFANLGNDCDLKQVLSFIKDNPWVKNFNKLPKVTIYTCALNSEKYIKEAMNSVITQRGFEDFEYILIDDGSTDKTPLYMNEIAAHYPNVKYIRNPKNIGLASSSNIAISKARGKHIIRLDADDYFVGDNCIKYLSDEIGARNIDALYPNFYEGDFSTIGLGPASHHPAGAMFKTLALNHLRFKEGLRAFDGLDLYKRAKDQLKIGYINRPMFFYRQHEESLSKNNLEQRAKIKQKIERDLDWHPV